MERKESAMPRKKEKTKKINSKTCLVQVWNCRSQANHPSHQTCRDPPPAALPSPSPAATPLASRGGGSPTRAATVGCPPPRCARPPPQCRPRRRHGGRGHGRRLVCGLGRARAVGELAAPRGGARRARGSTVLAAACPRMSVVTQHETTVEPGWGAAWGTVAGRCR